MEDLTQWLSSIDWIIPLRIALVVVLAIIAHALSVRAINAVVKRATAKVPKVRPGKLRALDNTHELSEVLLEERTVQRAHAMGSLLKSASILTIWTVAVITILAIVGINVGPLLASAGILGVVIGFGAQQLVGDYLAGISMIFEDQLGVGDVVNVGFATGTVEQVALRYTRIRDFSGVVWYVRNGQMQYVANQSQGWTTSFVDIPIPYTADIDAVTTVITNTAHAIANDHSFDGILLDTPTLAGMEQVAGNQVTLRIIAKSVPDQQFVATRRLRESFTLALRDAGIPVPVQALTIREQGTMGTGGAS